MAQQNEKQPKAKTGLARCLELASGHKGLVFLAGFLAALAAICSFVPYLSIYYIIREILGMAGPGWNFGEHRILLFCPVVFPRCGVWNAL